jgi:hypothetical protein
MSSGMRQPVLQITSKDHNLFGIRHYYSGEIAVGHTVPFFLKNFAT